LGSNWIDEAGGSSWPKPSTSKGSSISEGFALAGSTLTSARRSSVLDELQARLASNLEKLRSLSEAQRAEAEARLEERRRELEEVERVEARTRALSAEGGDPDGHVRISISGGEAPSTVTISEELVKSGDAAAIAGAVSEALRQAQERLKRAILAEWAEAGGDATPDSPLAEVSRAAKERLDELKTKSAPKGAIGSSKARQKVRHALGNTVAEHEPDSSMGSGTEAKTRRSRRPV
jgi:DNA-binding protein YbaB